MELTTSEDIHVVCLFENLDDAIRFGKYVEGCRLLIKNRPDFFGHQQVLDGDDNFVEEEEHLLSNATSISLDEVPSLVESFGGISYPAHIDRDANGIVAILGTVPQDTEFRLFELHDGEKVNEYSERFGIPKENFIISSDAHILTDMREKENFFDLDDEPYSSGKVRSELFRYLRRL
jgi:hypothetical protein